ncbi:hypothetical protein PRIPAC_81252 [Pristionchus pacificus]|uniref:G protein-coupled receptor n=1 Tax=Pristionchus pacificus TaxID=54126 RepID=A0A8R1V5Y7_PRIPA|nr:hypothetical protein PRIPAC_81252 [Pristionchus pacificus]
MFLNLVLLFLILHRTSNDIGNYRYLLFSFVLNDVFFTIIHAVILSTSINLILCINFLAIDASSDADFIRDLSSNHREEFMKINRENKDITEKQLMEKIDVWAKKRRLEVQSSGQWNESGNAKKKVRCYTISEISNSAWSPLLTKSRGQ